ncbi:MAG: ABC transporter ATP-binding protein [Hyphomonadaceae bacterium]|nr:MAG: ABC transporter [Caulobacteraceae bacterium]MBT9445697.1 ABC transporter ATP-binding protein [Hyphomonadaceae bacterium]TPW08344.1 MAG: ABC transporter [Alphaproteobacteria bacterium]
MIEVEDVVYDYPTKRALRGVRFKAERGQVLALVGPNGAGKTTLLRCLAALDRPFSGAVRIDGIDTQDDPRRVHEKVGYLPDFYGLYDELTVEQNLLYAANARRVTGAKAREAMKRTVERIGLADRVKSRASELSRGLRQRLAIGQTIVHEPAALLLDEPAAGLDPEARRSLSALITSLAKGGMAIIVSSHILAELEDYSTAMLVMRDGALIGDGPVSAGGAVRVRITLARTDQRFPASIAAQAGVKVENADASGGLITLDGGAEGNATLLRALVLDNFHVATFAEERVSLEAAYMAAQSSGVMASGVQAGGRA